MNVFELYAKLGLDSSDFERGLDSARSAGSALGSGLASAARIGMRAVSAATTAVAGMGAASVKTGADFDASMSQVAATMGTTVDQIQELRDFAQTMGRTTAFSATQSADALNYMALAGYDAETSMAMLPNVLNLAAAGSMDLARASDMITDTQTAFGISLERTNLLVDEMAKAASTGNTSVEQLGDAFLTVGGLAAELNGGMVTLEDGTEVAVDGVQELEIALTAMANAGIKGSEAGTHMRNMLLKLSSPTSDGAVALEKMGVAVFDTEGNMRSLADVFGDLSDKLGEMTQEQKIQTISDLFNTRDLASAEALLNAVGEDWDAIGESILGAWGDVDSFNQAFAEILGGEDAFNGMIKGLKELGISQEVYDQMLKTSNGDAELFVEGLLEAANAGVTMEDLLNTMGGDLSVVEEAFNNTAGAASAMADTQLDNLAGDITLFKSALEGAQIAISDVLTPSLRDFVKFGTDGLSSLTGAFKEGGITGAMEEFGVILSDGLNMIVSKMPQFVDAGMKLLGALGKGILDNLPMIIDTAITIGKELLNGLISAIPSIVQGLSSALPQILQGLIDMLMELFSGLADILPELIPMVVTAIIDAFMTLLENADALINVAVTFITSLIQGIINALPILIERLPEVVMAIVDAIVNNLPLIIDAGIQIIGALVEAVLTNIGSLIAAGIQMLVSLIGGILNALPNLLVTGSKLVIELATSILKSLPELIAGGIQIVGAIVKGIVDTVGDVIEAIIGMINAIIDTIGDFLSGVFEAGVDIVTNIMDGIDSIGKNAAQWGKDLIDNFVGGIKDKIGAVVDTCKDIAGTIADYLGFSEPEKGELSDFHTFAPDMIDLFTSGLEAGKAQLENTLNDVISMPVVDAKDNMAYNQSSGSAGSVDMMSMIANALSGMIVQVNIGNEAIDGMISKSIQRTAYVSGGR